MVVIPEPNVTGPAVLARVRLVKVVPPEIIGAVPVRITVPELSV